MKNRKKAEALFDAITDINQTDIEDFAKYDDRLQKPVTSKKERPVLKIIAAAAACLVLFCGISVGLKLMESGSDPAGPSSSSTETAEGPEEIQVKKHVYKNEAPYAELVKNEFTQEEQEIADRYYNEMVANCPEFGKIPRENLWESVQFDGAGEFADYDFCIGGIGTDYRCTYNNDDYGIKEYEEFLNGWKVSGDEFERFVDFKLSQTVNDAIIELLKKNVRAYAEENGLQLARFVDRDPDDILERFAFHYDENGLYVQSVSIADSIDLPVPHIYACVGVEINGDTITLTEYPAALEPILTTDKYEYSFTPSKVSADVEPPYAKPEKKEFTAEQKELIDRVYNEMLEKYPDFGKIDRDMLAEEIFCADNNTMITFRFCLGDVPTPYYCMYNENLGGYKNRQIYGEEFKPFSDWKIPEILMSSIKLMLKEQTLNLMKAEKLDTDNFDLNKMSITWSVEDGVLYANSEYIAAATDRTGTQNGSADPVHVFTKVKVEKQNNVISLNDYPATLKSEPETDIGEETDPVSEDWDDLDTEGRVERAMYEIINYGLNYQRFRYLCGDEHADDISGGNGYYLGDEPLDNFTFGYFLDLYDTETEPMRKQLMFVYISSFLTDTWNDDTRTVPYTTKYLPNFDNFKADNLPRFDASYNEECDKWIHEYYYSAFCKYAQNMTENEVKTKYAPSYKLIKKYGFNNFLDSSKSYETKATRVISEFFNMALSVKYGIAVNDPTSNVYFRYSEEGRSSTYEPGDAVYTALLKYYTKNELDRSDSAPAVSEQREEIKTIDKWKEYFSSLTTESIADDFVKENKYFFTTEDGRVLTCNSYYFFNTNNLNTPSIYGNYESGKIYVNDVDESRYYTVVLSEEDGKLKITGGTLVTEWLKRTLSPEECAIRDTIMDVEKLYHVIQSGIVDDFKYYSFDIRYTIEYGNNKDLPAGLEEKLNETSVRETLRKKHYISDRVVQSSYGLDTYDNWIRYFSRILPEDLVKNYIKETNYFLVVDGSVYLVPNALQSWLEIDYGTMKITGEEGGIITVSAVITGTSAPDREVTFELERADNGYGYRIIGGTFIDLYISFPQYGSPANFIYAAIWSLSPTDKLVEYKNFYDADENNLPNGFAEKLNEYYGDTRSYYHYFIFADRDGNVIKSIGYYKNRAYEFYSTDIVDNYFRNNKDYIEADGVLYVCENFISFLDVDEIYGIEKLSDTKYKIEMRIIETGTAPGVPTWDCNAYVDIINGAPVITGGTFVTDVIMEE
ncbi:MAG: hypothetical protein IKH51_02720 [Clostridia bacterium]|nr:hypothetical protein [Clostridia bacterium]